jgi:hypothetical protein
MCDLMNNTPLEDVISNSKRLGPETHSTYRINNREHNMLKGFMRIKSGYIDVSNGAFSKYIYSRAIDELRSNNQSLDTWVGSHWHPTVIPDSILTTNKVIVITNERYASRLLLFIRLVNGIIKLGKGRSPWDTELGVQINDEIKQAILAGGFDLNDPLDDSLMFDLFPDYLRSLQIRANNIWRPHPLCQNVEFEDIVNGNFVRDNNLNIEVFNYWKSINSFLYQEPNQKLKEYFDNSLL